MSAIDPLLRSIKLPNDRGNQRRTTGCGLVKLRVEGDTKTAGGELPVDRVFPAGPLTDGLLEAMAGSETRAEMLTRVSLGDTGVGAGAARVGVVYVARECI